LYEKRGYRSRKKDVADDSLKSTLRLPGLEARACLSTSSRPRVQPRGSGLTLSRAFSPPSLKTGLGVAEWVKHILLRCSDVNFREESFVLLGLAEGSSFGLSTESKISLKFEGVV
jgi:hypothetical protein